MHFAVAENKKNSGLESQATRVFFVFLSKKNDIRIYNQQFRIFFKQLFPVFINYFFSIYYLFNNFLNYYLLNNFLNLLFNK